jgi:hypothetical protein
MPVAGAVITGGCTVVVGFIVTHSLTSSIKKTEFMLGFSRQFGEVNKARYEHNKKSLATSSPDIERVLLADAEQIYREYFTLLFDEFYAFRRGFLDRNVFALWMSYCAGEGDDDTLYAFNLKGASYNEAWRAFRSQNPLKGDVFLNFLDDIHRCRTPSAARRVVRLYSRNLFVRLLSLVARR